MEKILTSSKYEWIFLLVFFCIVLVAIVSLQIFYDPQNGDYVYKITSIIILSIIDLVIFIVFLITFQFAILNKDGIEIRCIICKLVFIKWENVTKLSITKVNTSSSSVGLKYYHNFIQIHSSARPKLDKIIMNKKNLDLILSYIKKYSPTVDISEITNAKLDFNSSTKWF